MSIAIVGEVVAGQRKKIAHLLVEALLRGADVADAFQQLVEVVPTAGLLEAIAVIAGIDRILDIARTSVNAAGDLMMTALVGKSEGELDEEIYNGPNQA